MQPAPLRILHVVYSLEPGGMENGLVNVARALDPARFQIHACCLTRAGDFAARLPDPALVTALHRPPGYSVETALAIARVLRRVRPHLIHTHNYNPLFYTVCARFLAPRAPILQGEHGMLVPIELTRRYLALRRWLYRRCARVQTVSQSLRRHFIEHGFPADRIEAVVNGVDTARFAPGDRASARTALGIPQDAFLIGVIGRLQRIKRHHEILDAFDALAAARPRLHLLVAGGGTAEEVAVLAARVAASPHRARLHVLGHRDDPRPCYHALDLMLSASLREGMPNVVVEAMACGVPVLAHDAPATAEIVTTPRDGFLADLSSVPALSAEIIRLMDAPALLAAASHGALATARERFSFASMVARYDRLYRELAAK